MKRSTIIIIAVIAIVAIGAYLHLSQSGGLGEALRSLHGG